MAYLTANGLTVARATIHLPRSGAWHAEVELEDEAQLAGAVTLDLGGGALELVGTVRRGGMWAGGGVARVVAGAGGWPQALPAAAYKAATVRLVLQDVLAGAGEALSSSAAAEVLATVLPLYVRTAGTAGGALAALLECLPGISWRHLADGTVWLGAESWPVVTLDAEITAGEPHQNRLVMFSDEPTLLPGVTWMGQRVSRVVHHIGEELSTEVLFEDAPEDVDA